MNECNSPAILLGLIFDSDIARAEHLAADINARFGAGRARTRGDLSVEMAEADGLINATPVGTAKLPGMPLPASFLRPEL
jgi:shikimate dehydrogenase